MYTIVKKVNIKIRLGKVIATSESISVLRYQVAMKAVLLALASLQWFHGLVEGAGRGRVTKCCPGNTQLAPLWHSCIPGPPNHRKAFQQHLDRLEGGEAKVLLLLLFQLLLAPQVLESSSWPACPSQRWSEHEVMALDHVAASTAVYVFGQAMYDVPEGNSTSAPWGVELVVPACLELVRGVAQLEEVLVALVCEEEGEEGVEEGRSYVEKCCRHGESLSPDFSGCVEATHGRSPLPPR